MAYAAEISRVNPTCFLFLVDQSGSMRRPFGRNSETKKSEGVADAINRLLYGLVLRCAGGQDIVDRYYIGVIGYGTRVGSALGGDLAGQGLVPVSQIGNHPLRIERRSKKVSDGAGGLVETTANFPVWIDPVAEGNKTPMCAALAEAKKTIGDFVGGCRGAFPPIVINVTDGQANDGDPEPEALALRNLATEDGQVLLFNVHISVADEPPIQFPVDEARLPDKFARLLFRMSSPLPPKMLEEASEMGFDVAEGARGFVFNGDLVSVVQFLDIGTRHTSR
ncbi:MAG: VWA domain-containing protein [Planctomycetota bacterium]|nr:VWA domain-containing protein [Planctomycetota bacterium]